MNVLVATIIRMGTPVSFWELSDRFYAALTWEPKERALLADDAGGTRFVRQARARNQLIERDLKPEYTHVFWMDVDLIHVPPDLIESLSAVGSEHIVAPMVFLEASEANHRYPEFYDVNAFIKGGKEFTRAAPYCRGGKLLEMDSVGTCYLIPADVYRRGGHYEAVPGQMEHVSLMAQARAMGYRIFALRDVAVWHANWPLRGYDWADKDRRECQIRNHQGG